MTSLTIRTAGQYTITWDNGALYCNGVRTAMAMLSKPLANGAVAIVDTKCKGANGKIDQVSLQPEQVAVIIKAGQDRSDDSAAAYRKDHAADIAAANALQARADAYDRGSNEGGEGFNPYRANIKLPIIDEPIR